jgi:NAD(P)-dependent dehydrogenase (short-subunit alcohol dehydrogenase family)
LKTPGEPIVVDLSHAPDLRGRHVLVSRHGAEVDAVRAGLGGPGRHVALEADVTDAGAVRAMIADAVAQSGALFALVNNAGGGEAVAFVDADEAHWRRMIDVNLMSAVFCTQAALPAMLTRREGRVIHMASTASLRGYRHVSAYTAGKHALLGLTRALAIEVEKDGVTVNAVCPGYVHTERLGESLRTAAVRTGMSEEQVRARFAASNAGGRLVEPHEVAAVVAWLCGAPTAAVTGRYIIVDGRPLEARA